MCALRVSLLFAAVWLLSGCSWMSSLNPFASSRPQPAQLTGIQSTATLASAWQARIGSAEGYVFHPAVVDNAVFAVAHNGMVARFEQGREIWRAKTGSRLTAGVGSDGELAVVVTAGGEVIALDAASGQERWRASAGAEVLAPPAVADAFVVVRASDNRLLGFNAADGSFAWTYQRTMPPLALRNTAGLVVDGKVAVVGYPGGKLVALNIENGGALWELTVTIPRGVTELERIADIAGTAVLHNSEICAVAFQGKAACFDLTDGHTIWSRDFSSSVGMDRDVRFVVITDANDNVRGLDVFSGDEVWRQDALTRRQVSRPLIVGDFVAVGDFEGYLHLLDRETGKFVARVRTDGSAVRADPQSLGSDGIVIQTQEGGIFAFEAQ